MSNLLYCRARAVFISRQRQKMLVPRPIVGPLKAGHGGGHRYYYSRAQAMS